jgi:hypothetical protein
MVEGQTGMKRARAAVAASLIFLAWVSVLSGDGLETRKKAGDYDVGMRIDRNPPVRGDNTIEISVTEGDGSPVKDVSVLVNYYMPPMPRMAPMNYKVQAKAKNDVFRAKMSFIMEGPWIIAVKITREDRTVTAKFNINVH